MMMDVAKMMQQKIDQSNARIAEIDKERAVLVDVIAKLTPAVALITDPNPRVQTLLTGIALLS